MRCKKAVRRMEKPALYYLQQNVPALPRRGPLLPTGKEPPPPYLTGNC